MVWCSKRIAIYAGLLIGPSVAAVFWLGHKPAHVEIEWALGILAAFLFLFFTVGLYRGARLKRPGESEIDARTVYQRRKAERTARRNRDKNEKGSWWDLLDGVPDIADLFAADEGCIGILVGALIAVVVVGLLAFLAYIFAQLGIDPFAVVAGGLGWVIYRGFRRVFLGRRGCAGNLGASLANSAGFTLLYTGWGFLLIEVLKRVV